jgi:cell division protein FtsX
MVVWFGYWLGVDITDQQTLTHSDKMLAIGFDVLLMLSLYVSFIGLVVTGVNKLFKIKK